MRMRLSVKQRLSASCWPAACVLLALVSQVACSVQQGGSGAACMRSAECAAGLACSERACSDDLSSIGNPGEVPMLMPEEQAEPEIGDASDTDVGDAQASSSADGG